MKKFFYHINLFFVVLSTILSLQSQNSSYQIVIGDDEDETDPKVVIAPNGNYFLFNRTTSNSFGRADMMLTMISGNGEPIWSKNFGSDYREYSKNIYQLGNEYLLLGWRSDIGKADMWFIGKMDMNGNITYSKHYGRPGYDHEIHCASVLSQNILAVGGTFVNLDGNITLSFLSDSLELLESYVYDDLYGSYTLRDIITTDNDNLIIVGSYNSAPLIASFNDSGDIIFMHKVNIQDCELRKVIKIDIDNYIAIGYTGQSVNSNYDILAVQFNKEGTINWVKTYGGLGSDRAYDLKMINDTIEIVGESSSFRDNKDILKIRITREGEFIEGLIWGTEFNEEFGDLDYRSGSEIIIVNQFLTDTDYNIIISKIDDNSKLCGSMAFTDFNSGEIQPSVTSINPKKAKNNIMELSYRFYENHTNQESYIYCDDNGILEYIPYLDYLSLNDTCELAMSHFLSINNDHINEKIIYTSSNSLIKFHFIVYNSSGELVFETKNPKEYWKGRRDELLASTGFYYYKVVYQCYNDRFQRQSFGKILLTY